MHKFGLDTFQSNSLLARDTGFPNDIWNNVSTLTWEIRNIFKYQMKLSVNSCMLIFKIPPKVPSEILNSFRICLSDIRKAFFRICYGISPEHSLNLFLPFPEMKFRATKRDDVSATATNFTEERNCSNLPRYGLGVPLLQVLIHFMSPSWQVGWHLNVSVAIVISVFLRGQSHCGDSAGESWRMCNSRSLWEYRIRMWIKSSSVLQNVINIFKTFTQEWRRTLHEYHKNYRECAIRGNSPTWVATVWLAP